MMHRALSFLAMAAVSMLPFCAGAVHGQTSQLPPELSSQEVISRVSPSVVMVLTGEGAGRLAGVGSGVIVRSEGILLTAYHVVKDAREVQVRLKSGEVYDHVDLVAADERRDVAALHISATNLPALPVELIAETRPGDPVYVVSNPTGLSWTASAGILSAVRPVEEVLPQQSGYRVLQFTAPISPGSSGGIVVDARGRVLGIVVFSKQGQALNFAIPVETVLGLSGEATRTPLPQGRDLQPQLPARPLAAAVVVRENPVDLLRNARTVFVHTRTVWFTADTLEKDLLKDQQFHDFGLVIVKDRRLADLVLEVDRPLWTFTFTVAVLDARTSIVLGNDSVIAGSGDLAATSLASKTMKIIAAAHSNEPATKKNN